METMFKWWEIGVGILFLIVMFFFFYFTDVYTTICEHPDLDTQDPHVKGCVYYTRADIIFETDKYLRLNESTRNQIRPKE